MNRKKLAGAISCALFALLVLEVRTASASSPTEWTQNSTFNTRGYKWDPILYDWEFDPPPPIPDLPPPFPNGDDTHRVPDQDLLSHAWWLQNGTVNLAAYESVPDFYGRSARVTYGPFLNTYSDIPPSELSVSNTETLTLKGVVSNYGSANFHPMDWTGIKFDAWFTDPSDSNRRMVIEMYFHGTGEPQNYWDTNYHSEYYRTLGADIDDLLIKLQAFPEYCTMTGDIPSSSFGSLGTFLWSHTEFTIDLKSIWQRAAGYFGRSSSDRLYAVALDVETGMFPLLTALPCGAIAEVNEIKVTSTSPPNTPTINPPGVVGYVRASYMFAVSTHDPDYDRVWYHFDWGDGTSNWLYYLYDSDTIANASHAWSSGGDYTVQVFAQDETGLFSGSSSWTINMIGPNTPPYTPMPPLGSTNAYVYDTKIYSASTTDPNTDRIRYQFDWGDNTPITDTGYYLSDEQVNVGHTWTRPGTYGVSVRAIDEYYESQSGWSSQTQVTISQNDANTLGDAGNTWSTANTLQLPGTYMGTLYPLQLSHDYYDYYSFSAQIGDQITVYATPGAGIDIGLNLYDPNIAHQENPVYHSDNGGYGQTEAITYLAGATGYWKIEVYYSSGQEGYYQFSITAAPPSPPPGPPGCPYLYVWNGTALVADNNILPTSERSNGTDVDDYYKLEQTLAPTDGKYSLIIGEFEHEHSYIDQVQLLAVDHDSDVKIAVDPDGQILTYKNPEVPKSAVDNYEVNRLSEIRLMDGDVSNPATFFYGNTSDYLILNFGRVDSDNAKLILRDDQKCPECCIDVQVWNSTNQWQTVATIAPRSYWGIEGLDLSRYVVRNRDFKVRLVWTSPHKLDYAGLDTSRQADYQVTYANLISATHSTQGNVTSLVTTNDNQYAELVSGQLVLLDFTLLDNQQEARTYILYTEGHYFTIP